MGRGPSDRPVATIPGTRGQWAGPFTLASDIEQVISDLKNSALAHFPSASMNANAAWLVCAVIAYNLTRAAGVLAGRKFARAHTGTIRAKLIAIPARIATTGRATILHLPEHHRHQQPFQKILDTVRAPPKAA